MIESLVFILSSYTIDKMFTSLVTSRFNGHKSFLMVDLQIIIIPVFIVHRQVCIQIL